MENTKKKNFEQLAKHFNINNGGVAPGGNDIGASNSDLGVGNNNADFSSSNPDLGLGNQGFNTKNGADLNIGNLGSANVGILKMGRLFFSVLLGRLYYLIAIPAMVVTYNVFKALDAKDGSNKSILDRISDIIQEAVDDIVDISNQCPGLIGDFPKFLDCLGF